MVLDDFFEARSRPASSVWLVPPYRTDRRRRRFARRTAAARRSTSCEEDGFDEQAAMLCPCGCKRVLHMNLFPTNAPAGASRSTATARLHSIRRSGAKRIAARISGSGAAAFNGVCRSGDPHTEGQHSRGAARGLPVD